VLSAPILFSLNLLVTVALLGAAFVTGLRGRLAPHLVLVALTLASLGTTIYFAERLGELYDLDAAGAIKPLHLAIAKLATLAYLGPIVTGFMNLRDRRWQRLHFRVALAVAALTLLAAVTGTWMLLASPRLPT
jgi:hypothetical protein